MWMEKINSTHSIQAQLIIHCLRCSLMKKVMMFKINLSYIIIILLLEWHNFKIKISKYSFRFIELEKFAKLQKFRKKVGEYHFWTQRSRKNHQNQDSDSLDYPYGPKPKISTGGTRNPRLASQIPDRKGYWSLFYRLGIHIKA